jgi:hypothetical protein
MPAHAAASHPGLRPACGPSTIELSDADSGPSTRPCADAGRDGRDRKLLIAGGVVGGTGLLLAAVGFGIYGGILAGNPGKGAEISFEDERREIRVVRLARGMQAIGITGSVLMGAGIVLVTIGLARRPSAVARRARLPSVAVAPGIGSLTLVGRF